LTPAIGPRPIDAIEPAELLVVLKKIEKAGKRETAVQTRAFASRVFRHGVAVSRHLACAASKCSSLARTVTNESDETTA
jgi:hypothetical protein